MALIILISPWRKPRLREVNLLLKVTQLLSDSQDLTLGPLIPASMPFTSSASVSLSVQKTHNHPLR